MRRRSLEEPRPSLWICGFHPGCLEKPFLAGNPSSGCHCHQVKVVSSIIQIVFFCSRRSFNPHQPPSSTMPFSSREGAGQEACHPPLKTPGAVGILSSLTLEKVATIISSLKTLHLRLYNYLVFILAGNNFHRNY